MSRVNHVCTEHKYQQCNMVRKRNSNVARQWNSGSEHYHILATSTDLRQLAMWRLLIPRDTSCLQVQSLPGEPATRWSHTAPTGSGNQSYGSHTAPTGSRNQSDVGNTLHSLLAVTVKASCTLVVRRLCTCTKCTVEWLYSQLTHVAAVQLYKTQVCSQHKHTFLDRVGYEVCSKCTRTYPCSVSLQQA